MKFKKALGSEAVQALIQRASEAALARPFVQTHEEWVHWRHINREEIELFVTTISKDLQ